MLPKGCAKIVVKISLCTTMVQYASHVAGGEMVLAQKATAPFQKGWAEMGGGKEVPPH